MQTEAGKLSVFFQKFKERACGLGDNQTKPDAISYFGVGVNNNLNVIKGICFQFFSKILTFTLTLTRWIIKI